MAIAIVFAVLFGLIIGSFLNVVAWRLPRGESLSHPPSACPKCGTPIKPYDNVPVFAWLWLRGRCRACGEPISPRYPLVELTTGVLYGAVMAATWDDEADIAFGLVLVTLLVVVTLIDLDHRLIPNKLTYPAAPLAIAIGLALNVDDVPEQLIAGAAAAAFFFVAALAYPRGMGMGDVKLAGVMGLYLGRAVAPAIFIALVTGVLVGAVIMARVGVAKGRKQQVPFGPFLAFGGVVAVLCGDAIVDAYLDTF
jgi:leader peptidase (prepilin peptidase)/N-methyltransferase